MTALLNLGIWVPILDGDPSACAIYEGHYSARRSLATRRERGTMLFLGPGEKLVLSTPCRLALFAWRRSIYRADKQAGIECTIFSNKGAGLSSELITAADAIADSKWPGERHFTYVDPVETASRRSRNSRPGACFIHAGWREVEGLSKRGLFILERHA